MTKRAAPGVVLAVLVATLFAAGQPAAKPARADQPMTVGVVPQRGFGGVEAARMRVAGIGSVRSWFGWFTVEATRDRYDWGALDHLVTVNSEAGLETLPFLFGTPAWASHRDGYGCEADDCIPFAPRSIETRYAFARFAGAAVRRYGPLGSFWRDHPDLPYLPIRAWQVWNEQNLQSFHEPDVDALAYSRVLELTAAEIRSADPAAEVLLGGMFGDHPTARRLTTKRYLRQLYRIEGIEESFDGVAIHPYSPKLQGVLSQVRSARSVIRAAGDNVPLWITELGWASSGMRRENLVKGRRGQARMLRRAFTKLIARTERWNLRGAYWYAWRDTSRKAAVCDWCPGAGLIDVLGRAKPAYRVLRRIATE